MERRITISVDGAEASYALLDHYAPKSTEALWQSLPLQATLRHGKLSGEACFFDVETGPMLDLDANPELPVTSIYKGYVVLTNFPALGHAELLLSYGVAEYRWPTGRRHVTPVAMTIAGDELFAVLRRMFTEGAKEIEVRRAGEDS